VKKSFYDYRASSKALHTIMAGMQRTMADPGRAVKGMIFGQLPEWLGMMMCVEDC
jgi:hypothetical protein